jgi:hypothetical protein
MAGKVTTRTRSSALSRVTRSATVVGSMLSAALITMPLLGADASSAAAPQHATLAQGATHVVNRLAPAAKTAKRAAPAKLKSLGTTAPRMAILSPGGQTSFVLESRPPAIAGQFWHQVLPVGPGRGLTVTPEIPHGSGQVILVRASDTMPDGLYWIVFHPDKPVHGSYAPLEFKVLVERPGSILTYFNNTGIINNHSSTSPGFDMVGHSYSAQALAKDGATPGKLLHIDGFTFMWPDDFANNPDNIVTQGQTIPLSGSGTTLGILGAASNGPSKGMLLVHYTDGDEQGIVVGFSDWTLNGGSTKKLLPGERIALEMPYRDRDDGQTRRVHTYVFFTQVPLLKGKTVESVTLPAVVNQGHLHIFALAIKGAAASS